LILGQFRICHFINFLIGGKEMTAPTDAKKTTPAKKVAPVVTETTGVDKRIPESLANNSLLGNFFLRYLDGYDDISKYNEQVLAEKNSGWNTTKVLAKAKEFASPEDPAQVNEDVKKAYDEFERLVTEMQNARKSVIDATAKVLGISLSDVAQRDPAVEASLKEKRKLAVEIGTQLSTIAKMTTDEDAAKAVEEFFNAYPLPAIGREQTRSFTDDGKNTPKYRVEITVTKDGTQILKESGFTKTALKLSQPVFGYARGKSLKSEDLRKAWESAGNSPEETKQETVEFEDNGLFYTITKK
jgi:hypothetical protein